MEKYFGGCQNNQEKNLEKRPLCDSILNIYLIIQLIFHQVPAMSGPVPSSKDIRPMWIPTFRLWSQTLIKRL